MAVAFIKRENKISVFSGDTDMVKWNYDEFLETLKTTSKGLTISSDYFCVSSADGGIIAEYLERPIRIGTEHGVPILLFNEKPHTDEELLKMVRGRKTLGMFECYHKQNNILMKNKVYNNKVLWIEIR